jgi:hypothetical protein
MSTTISKRVLTIAGLLSLGVAAFHVALTFSADWSGYFGATPEVVQMLRAHDPLVYDLMVFLIAVFTLFGLYGLSAAGSFQRLPLLRTGLVTISAIYTLRGLVLIPETLGRLGLFQLQTPPQALVSSAVSLTIGTFYAWGTFAYWRRSSAQ